MTLANLLADVYRRLAFASAPAADVTTRLTAFLNETQQDLMSEPGTETFMNDVITFA